MLPPQRHMKVLPSHAHRKIPVSRADLKTLRLHRHPTATLLRRTTR
jgi:hypothetical protein